MRRHRAAAPGTLAPREKSRTDLATGEINLNTYPELFMRYPEIKTTVATVATAAAGTLRAALLCLVAALPTGCGSSVNLGDIAAIDVRNALDITATVVSSLTSVIAAGNEGGSAVTGVVVSSNQGRFSLADFSKLQLQRVMDLQAAAATSAGTTTVTCSSGDITIVQNPPADTGTSGSTYTLTFNNCRDRQQNITYQGTATVSDVQSSGDLATPATAGSLSATFDLNGLQVTDRSGTATFQGSFNYSTSTDDGVLFNQSISGTKLAFTKASDLIILSTFKVTLTQDANTSAFTFIATGNLHSATLGSVTYENLKPFGGVGLLSNSPNSGTMKITGRSNTSITMSVGLTGVVTVNVDTDGNGTKDYTIASNWAALI